MNAKKCKALRQKLRASDIDPRQTAYRSVKRGHEVQTRLDRCGRLVYQEAKFVAKQVR